MKQLDLAAYKKRAQAEMDWLAQEEKANADQQSRNLFRTPCLPPKWSRTSTPCPIGALKTNRLKTLFDSRKLNPSLGPETNQRGFDSLARPGLRDALGNFWIDSDPVCGDGVGGVHEVAHFADVFLGEMTQACRPLLVSACGDPLQRVSAVVKERDDGEA